MKISKLHEYAKAMAQARFNRKGGGGESSSNSPILKAAISLVALAVFAGVMIQYVFYNLAIINTTATPQLAPVPPVATAILVVTVILSAVGLLRHIKM